MDTGAAAMRRHEASYRLDAKAPRPPAGDPTHFKRYVSSIRKGSGRGSHDAHVRAASGTARSTLVESLLRPPRKPTDDAYCCASPEVCSAAALPAVPTADDVSDAQFVSTLRPASIISEEDADRPGESTGAHAKRRSRLERHIVHVCRAASRNAVPGSKLDVGAGLRGLDELKHRLEEEAMADVAAEAAKRKPHFQRMALRCPQGFGPPPGAADPAFDEAVRSDALFFAKREARRSQLRSELEAQERYAATARKQATHRARAFDRELSLNVPSAVRRAQASAAEAGVAPSDAALVDEARRRLGLKRVQQRTPRQAWAAELSAFNPHTRRPVHERLLTPGSREIVKEQTRTRQLESRDRADRESAELQALVRDLQL